MLKKIFLYTALLLIAYSVVLRLLPSDIDTDQSQWGTNVIKARDYILSEEDFENVIVGTSLSTRLVTDSLGDDFVNLSFSGSTIWDGIELIEAREQKPKRVFIESTFVFKKTDGSLTDYVSKGFSSKLKSTLPVFREKNQPVGVIKGLVTKALKSGGPLASYDSVAVEINPEILEIQSDYFVEEYTDENYEWIFTKKLIWPLERLLDQGIEVVFYEMPLHPSFCESQVIKDIRWHIDELTKREGVSFLKVDDYEAYQTNDGIHLVSHSGLKFTQKLKSHL
jgi:hypothetical protein